MSEDIVERLRREAKRFAAMDAAAEQPWVADAAWAADHFSAAADEIEQLRAALLCGTSMRGAQIAYFKSRTQGALAVAKQAEAEFDRRVRALLTGGAR